MVKARLLQAVCAVALLAAAPAFAQTNAKPADTGVDNTVNAPATHTGTMSPAMHMGADDQSSGTMHHMSTHRSAMGGHETGMMHGRSDSSQDAAVDRLNDQSFQAAQSGQTYGGPNMQPGGMSGGSASGAGSATGASDGSGGSGK
jgi:hypothetical protein